MNLERGLKALSEMLCASSPETENCLELKTLISKHTDWSVDSLGNIIATKKASEEVFTNIVIDAHVDEVSLVVTGITNEGFLRVAACGGIDPKACYGARVQMITTSTKQRVSGVVCSLPPHLGRSSKNKLPDIEEMLIDIGMEKERALEVAPIGARFVWDAKFNKLPGGLYSGKALDNRAGCLVLCYFWELISDKKLKNTQINLVFSTMEEFGSKTLACALFTLKPTQYVVVDATFGANKAEGKYGQIGKGPMIGVSPVLDAELTDIIKNIAQEAGIPYQLEVMGGETGTNADGQLLMPELKKPLLISLPIKNMHSQVEVLHIKDIEAAARILLEFVLSFENQSRVGDK